MCQLKLKFDSVDGGGRGGFLRTSHFCSVKIFCERNKKITAQKVKFDSVSLADALKGKNKTKNKKEPEDPLLGGAEYKKGVEYKKGLENGVFHFFLPLI